MDDNVRLTNGTQDGGSPGCPGNPGDESALLRRFAGLSGVELVAALQADLTERWQRGERCLVDPYLRHPLLAADDEAILDLIFHEFLVRSLHSESPRIEEYVDRFPSYGDRLHRLLSLDRGLFPTQPIAASMPAEEANQPVAPGPVASAKEESHSGGDAARGEKLAEDRKSVVRGWGKVLLICAVLVLALVVLASVWWGLALSQVE
jgi:hypothetical protein